jgi:hypothetical protein
MPSQNFKIKGLPPGMLMHKFNNEVLEPGPKPAGAQSLANTPIEKDLEICEFHAHRNIEGKLAIPSLNLYRALVIGAGFVKASKGRGTLSKYVAACIAVTPSYLIIDPQEYEVSRMAAVNPNTKGRIITIRPLFPEWSLEFTIAWDKGLLDEIQIKECIIQAGKLAGLGPYRPAKKGPYGRFEIID